MSRIAAAAFATCAGALGTAYYVEMTKGPTEHKRLSLSSCKQRFDSFASLLVPSPVGRQPAMTMDDFAASLCTSERLTTDAGREAMRTAQTTELKNIFALFDANGDGQLSYDEFCVLYTVIATPLPQFEVALRMIDSAGDGLIDAEQFKAVMNAVSADPTATIEFAHNGLVQYFFGAKQDGRMARDAFLVKVKSLAEEIYRTEFNLACVLEGDGGDGKRKRALPPAAIRRVLLHEGMHISSRLRGATPASLQQADTAQGGTSEPQGKEATGKSEPTPIPLTSFQPRFKAVAATRSAESSASKTDEEEGPSKLLKSPFESAWTRLAKVGRGVQSGGSASTPLVITREDGDLPLDLVTQDDYVTLMHVLRASSRWMRALELYQKAVPPPEGCDSPCDLPVFARALSAAGVRLTARQLRLAFEIFDADGSGALSPQEMDAVASARRTFFSKYAPDYTTPKRNVVQQFAYCMQQKSA